MNDGILVNHATLSAASTQLLNSATQIDDRLNTLEGELARLSSAWTGTAQEAYLKAKNTWDTAIADIIGLLRDTGAMVETSNGEYQSADLRGAARFQ